MASNEQKEAKEYFLRQTELRKKSRSDVLGIEYPKWKSQWRGPNPERDHHILVLSEVASEKRERRVVKEENWPVLIENIGDTNDALITLTILKEGRKNGTGKVTYGEIRRSLVEKMHLAEDEIEPVLGKYNGLQERCNRLTGDIIQQSRTAENNRVYYSIAEVWQPQAEAYMNGGLSYAHHNLPFEAFGLNRKYEMKASSGLPLRLEVARFLRSQLLHKNKSVDAKTAVSTNAIIENFPEQAEYLRGYLVDMLQDFDTENLFTLDRVEADESRMECRLEQGAPESISTPSQRKQDAYRALWVLQKEGGDPEQYYTNLDIAYEMAKLFPDTYKFDEAHDADLTAFIHSFGNIMSPGKKRGLLSLRERVSQVRLTQHNKHEAVSDIDVLLTKGALRGKDSFITIYDSETDPAAIKRVWLAGKHFDPKEQYAYKNKYLGKILPGLEEFLDGTSREQCLAFLKQFSKKAETLLYFLENDGYLTKEKGERVLSEQNNVTVPAVVKEEDTTRSNPKVVFESRKQFVVDAEIKALARERKYAHSIQEEVMLKWKRSMQSKEILNRMTESEKVLWDFYQKLRAKDKDVVLREANHLIILIKPPGVFPYEDDSNLSIGAEELVRDVFSEEATLASVSHRDASGIIIFATDGDILEDMLAQMQNRELSGMTESYSAILDGANFMNTKTFLASDPLDYDDRNKRLIPTSLKKRNPNITMPTVEFTPRAVFRNPTSGNLQTFMHMELKVGTSEHARALAAYSLKMPVVGDPDYYPGSSKESPRMMMHADYVSFIDPKTGDAVNYTAPLENTFQRYLDGMIENEVK